MRVAAVPNEINEDRLCHEQSLQRDEWPWIGKTFLTSHNHLANAARQQA